MKYAQLAVAALIAMSPVRAVLAQDTPTQRPEDDAQRRSRPEPRVRHPGPQKLPDHVQASTPEPWKAPSTPQPGMRPEPAEPIIDVPRDLPGLSPDAFRMQLANLLGAEVRLPGAVETTLSIPKGKWTASRLLKAVSERAGWTWRRAFVLADAVSPADPPVTRLPSVGPVSIRAVDQPLERVMRRLVRLSRCPVEIRSRGLDVSALDPVQLVAKDTPFEDILSWIAANLDLQVRSVILFYTPDHDAQTTPEALAADNDDECLDEAEAESALIAALEGMAGRSIEDDGFPWEDMIARGRANGEPADPDRIMAVHEQVLTEKELEQEGPPRESDEE